ncbi:hypothetical protein GCM10019016_076230 [Streptomyces prasinosporus]|uniref:Uncharacterized protein n=1 Tax=Streptomyces prasinosporus TaxID=68256 RepID=A0ABP6U1E5_9ACTN
MVGRSAGPSVRRSGISRSARAYVVGAADAATLFRVSALRVPYLIKPFFRAEKGANPRHRHPLGGRKGPARGHQASHSIHVTWSTGGRPGIDRGSIGDQPGISRVSGGQ